MRIHMNRLRRTTVAALAPLLAVAACTIKDDLLEPQQPQVISPTDVQNGTGAVGLYTGALGWARITLNGGNNNQESAWNFSGLMTDEFKSGDTFAQRNDADQRVTATNDGVLTPIYNSLQQTRGRARDAIVALTSFAPDEKAKIAEMYLHMGFAELQLSQMFCNGIPFGETTDGLPESAMPVSNDEGFKLAIARFDTALAVLGSSSDPAFVSVRNAVLIAKGRALVDRGQFAAAASTVATVPTAYQYLLTFSQTTRDNEWWTMQFSTKRYTVGDSVDATGVIANALPFASAKDPRVPVTVTGKKSFDGSTPYNEAQLWGRDDPIAMVAGLDARLIEAEAKLNASDIAGMLTILNALRSAPPSLGAFKVAAMPALVAPATQAAAVSLFFREKAFWQFGRGERLSDLRRLVRQYGRTQEQVFPSGPFFKNGSYGSGVNFPVPDRELANPNFTGCADRKA